MRTSPPETSVLSTQNLPAPEWLRNLATARAHFEERFGWPVVVQVAERQLTVELGRTIDAVTMPIPLATRVHAQLGIALLSGPVIAHPDSEHWTLLAQAATTDILMDGLSEYGVRYGTAGMYATIPTETDGVSWQWIAEPRPNRMLPSVYAVIATVRRICAGQSL